MFRLRKYEKLSFSKLMDLADKELNNIKRQKVLSYAIAKLTLSEGDINLLALREWPNLSEANLLLFKERIVTMAGNEHNYVFKDLYFLTKDTYWLERYPDEDFEFCLSIAKALQKNEYGLHAYYQCIEMISSGKWQPSMYELLDLYKLGGSESKILWNRIKSLLDSKGDMWFHTIPDVAQVTNKRVAVMRWIATLKDSSDWAKFLKECPSKWRHLACREASAYYLRLWRKKNLKDQDL